MPSRFKAIVTTTAALGAALAVVAPGLAAPAFADRPVADRTVVVNGVDLTPTRGMQLSWVGCDDLYAATGAAPQAAVGLGPLQPPAGERSLGFDLAPGRAIGSFSWVDSLATTFDAGLSAYAPEGTTGVAWVGFQDAADTGTGLVWLGRADLAVPAGKWTSQDVTGLTYTWSRYDLVAQQPVATEPESSVDPATIAAMTAEHGDGPGFVSASMGCDGQAFDIDALRIGTGHSTTTYDLEGLTTRTTMAAPSARRVVAGRQVDLGGSLVDGTGAPLSGGTVMLEALPAGAEKWQVVDVVALDGSRVSVAVTPEVGTTYRWRFADRPMATGSTSAPIAIGVDSAVTADLDGRALVGTVTPGPAIEVVVWRRDKTTWQRVGTAPVGPQGGYRFALGSAGGRYAVTVAARPGLGAGRSSEVSLAAAPGSDVQPSDGPDPQQTQPTAPASPAGQPTEEQTDQPVTPES